MVIHPLHEHTNWTTDPLPSRILSHGFFHVKREEPKKIAIKVSEDEIWEKGLYVTFISLNDVEYIQGDRWMRLK